MRLGKVCGKIVSTRKADRLNGYSILLLQSINLFTFELEDSMFVSIDSIGAGEGEVVMCVAGSSARQTEMTASMPVDDLIVAIIDSVDLEGSRVYDKAASAPEREER